MIRARSRSRSEAWRYIYIYIYAVPSSCCDRIGTSPQSTGQVGARSSHLPRPCRPAFGAGRVIRYVFCPRDAVPIVSLAAKLVFLGKFGVVMNQDADAFIKAPVAIPPSWIDVLKDADIIDDEALAHLQRQRYRLAKIRTDHIPVPAEWLEDDPDLPTSMAHDLNQLIPAGLVGTDLEALQKTLGAFFAFIDSWHTGSNVTGPVQDEADLQNKIRTFLQARSLTVTEGSVTSGGKTDLLAENSVLVENKFTSEIIADLLKHALDAGTQGRRYAISLGSRVIIVPLAYVPRPGDMPSKPRSFAVRAITSGDDRRAEIRVLVPYGAATPSREKRTN